MRVWRWLVGGSVLVAGGVVAVVATVPAGAAVVPPDVYAVTGVGAQGLEVHVLDGASSYQRWRAHFASSAGRLDAKRWRFAVGDVNGDDVADLFAVDTQDNGGKSTGVHVYDGRTKFRSTLMNQRLPDLGSTYDAARYRFAAGDADGDGHADLFVIDARDNGGKSTAVHVLDGADRLGSFLAHRRLDLPAVDFDQWQIFTGDVDADGRSDVFAVNGRDSGTRTAVHVATAKSGYTRFDLNRVLPSMGAVSASRWVFSAADFDGDHRSDLVAVDTKDNGAKNVAVHALTAASAYQKFLMHKRSPIKPLDTARFTTITAWAPFKGPLVTLADLKAIYGSVPAESTVERGLPSLSAEMRKAGITTPARKAAFLATLRNESGFQYNRVQVGATLPYRGRGFIQLTGSFNYDAAGKYLGHDLLNNPDDAASLAYSAAIARWYWTVARNINAAADRLDMGAVDDAIGYRPEAAEDKERCDDFKAALRYFTGSVPAGINCTRH